MTRAHTASSTMSSTPDHLDVAIVGAGFAGLYMLYKLRGLGFSVRVYEAADNVGGTWFWNQYPGCRCDIESLLYSYSFSEELTQEWTWSERFATQPEILRYLNHVADRFELRPDIQFDTRITAAHFHDHDNHWLLHTQSGACVSARFCIMATGCLSAPRRPNIPGLQDFKGEHYQTASWPHEPISFAGKKVAVIGTGSTGIQLIPEVAKAAAHCYVFQRTPSFSVPARNAPLTPEFIDAYRARHDGIREAARRGEIFGSGELAWVLRGEEHTPRAGAPLSQTQRRQAFEERWNLGGAFFNAAFNDTVIDPDVNESACEFVRGKIRETVIDASIAERLTPRGYPIASKRICLDSNYYATFNRSNVSLIDALSTPIEAITQQGLRTTAAEFDLDMIIFATGFDAMTGALLSIDIRGCGGEALRDKWAHGPQTYLGLATAGFPNLFFVTGPGSPSVLSNMAVSIEQHVEWIADCLHFINGCKLARIEADPAAEKDWVELVNTTADATLFPVANSWYSGANVPGKPRVFMPYVGGVGVYREICNDIAKSGYTGFRMSGVDVASSDGSPPGLP